jgi:hypothetical protein
MTATPSSAMTAEILIVIEIAITEPAVAEDAIVKEPTIAVTDSVARYYIADATATRSPTIPPAISGVMTVHKLAAFIMRAAKNPATPIASSAALRRGSGWYDQRQQQSHDGDSKKVLPRILHKNSSLKFDQSSSSISMSTERAL